jgi:hypothetical protein
LPRIASGPLNKRPKDAAGVTSVVVVLVTIEEEDKDKEKDERYEKTRKSED